MALFCEVTLFACHSSPASCVASQTTQLEEKLVFQRDQSDPECLVAKKYRILPKKRTTKIPRPKKMLTWRCARRRGKQVGCDRPTVQTCYRERITNWRVKKVFVDDAREGALQTHFSIAAGHCHRGQAMRNAQFCQPDHNFLQYSPWPRHQDWSDSDRNAKENMRSIPLERAKTGKSMGSAVPTVSNLACHIQISFRTFCN